MAYIPPDSRIILLSNVPLDKAQADTLWFPDKNAQTTYFMSKQRREYTAQSYQRKDRGYIRLFNTNDADNNVKYEDIFDCNYLMYQNIRYGNRWFYAFINSIDYINDSVCEVRYTIDPIQTWFFDYSLHQCFVERCTPSSDEIGENILPEKIEVGEYVMNGTYDALISNFADPVVIFMYVNPDNEGDNNSGSYSGANYGGVFGACELWAFEPSDATGISAWINARSQHLDSIVGAYMCPKRIALMSPPESISGGYKIPSYTLGYRGVDSADAVTKTTPLNGYTPRNKKLYTYPYTYFHVDGPDGQSLHLRYEFFANNKPTFQITGNCTYPVEVNFYPSNYKNIPSGGGLSAYQEFRPSKLAMKGYPMASWSCDAFNAWLAQNSVPIALNMAGGIAASAGTLVGIAATGGVANFAAMAGGLGGALERGEIAQGRATGNVLGSHVANAIGVLAEGYRASIASDITGGSFETGSNDFAFGRMCFRGGLMTQPESYLKAIDKYFDMYGYTMNQHRLVNNHVRTRWTYVKTRGCTVEGSLPADDADYICACYDNGIRFWSDTVRPLDYSLQAGSNDFV